MKGSAITGPVGKEAAELWPVRVMCSSQIWISANGFSAYCQQFGRGDVSLGCFGLQERIIREL